MERSGGEVSAMGSRVSSDSDAAAGEDRLSGLPDDVLVLILLRLHTAAAAARTSILSRRWRRLWAILPELHFAVAPEPASTRAILESHEAALRFLYVVTLGAAPDSVAAWLPAAARRLSGRLVFINKYAAKEGGEEEDEDEDEAAAQGGAFELPCFGNATAFYLDLGFLGVAMPPAGIFARLTELCLFQIRFHGPCELGDAISSPRCPCLQKLLIFSVRGLNNLAIHSGSLLRVSLRDLRGLRQLTIVAPVLEDLAVSDLCGWRQLTIVAPVLENLVVSDCFIYDWNQPVASISAPQLVCLNWRDPNDPSSVDLGKMERVQWLSTSSFLVYGPDNLAVAHNRGCIRLLERFKVMGGLNLTLDYIGEIENCAYLMDDMTVLPDIAFLNLNVLTYGHAFGASAFHVLMMCSGIRRLKLRFKAPTDSEVYSPCFRHKVHVHQVAFVVSKQTGRLRNCR
ncbi:F-box/FBD/LRR-repeat protein At1g16930-like isoform X2 [Panicum virgatum]|uniref:F-box/FBD/LRR-repeat protein At1g16930-like isoform X2 n=1 Tax=Panicum virgatum TaxID=38727 RepID=UPI0019D56889|nr:F-box/FBD/LRR-repeat protein At1g16930-like isoform X2 [Panicum virgatum]